MVTEVHGRVRGNTNQAQTCRGAGDKERKCLFFVSIICQLNIRLEALFGVKKLHFISKFNKGTDGNRKLKFLGWRM